MTIRETILRLENVLQSWEEHHLLLALHLYAIKRANGEAATQPKIRLSHDFRQFLLKARADTEMDSRFMLEAPPGELGSGSPHWYNYDAQFLLAWTAHSRKVYKIDPGMQTLLMHTSLQGITWREIMLPYDAFAVCIETPIKVGDDCFDCFVLSRDGSGRVVIHASGENRNPWTQVGRMFVAKLQKLCHEQRWEEICSTIEARYKLRDSHAPPTMYLGASPLDQLIEGTSEWLEEHEALAPDFMDKASQTHAVFRLVAGLCLYITTLPSRVTRVKPPQGPRIASIDKSAVVRGADIMTVANFFTLTKGDGDFVRTMEQSKRGEMPTHWRRGFWRRTPGTGHIPDAPKNQWIRPTLIRPDRLPDAGVPAGTALRVQKPGS